MSTMFSSKHIQQAVHLADEALAELNKAERGDQAYTVDCYLSALDYLIAALPSNSTLSEFPGSAHRQALLNTKLGTLLDRTENSPSEPVTLSSAPSTWLSLLPRSLTLTRKTDSEPAPYKPKSQWTAQCQCGRHVSLQLAHEAPCTEADPEPMWWPETIISLVVSLAITLKNSPIPSMISLLFTSFISCLIYLEAVFQIQQRSLETLAAMVRRLAELDAELGIVQAIGNFISWLFESFCRAAIAFARAATSPQPSRTYNPAKRPSNGGRYLAGSTRNEGRLAIAGSSRRAPARIHPAPSQHALLGPRPSTSARPSLRVNSSTPNLRRAQSSGSYLFPRNPRSPSIESQASSFNQFSLEGLRSSDPLPEEEEEDVMELGDELYEDEPGWKSLDSSVKQWAKTTAGMFGYRASFPPTLFGN